jgi:hypothetical protein
MSAGKYGIILNIVTDIAQKQDVIQRRLAIIQRERVLHPSQQPRKKAVGVFMGQIGYGMGQNDKHAGHQPERQDTSSRTARLFRGTFCHAIIPFQYLTNESKDFEIAS